MCDSRDRMQRTSEFRQRGYILAKHILSDDAVRQLVQQLDDLSGRQRIGAWTVPDGVTQASRFWPLIFNEKLLEIVRQLIGPDIRFLQHNDLHVGFSSLNWH